MAVFHDARIGQELLKTCAHTYGACAGTASAMRGREGLMEIDVHDVETHVARPGYAEHRVEIRTVVIHQRAAGMDHFGNLGDIVLENTHSVRVGHHDCGHGVIEKRTERLYVHCTVGQTLDFDHFQSGYGCGSGVGTMVPNRVRSLLCASCRRGSRGRRG